MLLSPCPRALSLSLPWWLLLSLPWLLPASRVQFHHVPAGCNAGQSPEGRSWPVPAPCPHGTAPAGRGRSQPGSGPALLPGGSSLSPARTWLCTERDRPRGTLLLPAGLGRWKCRAVWAGCCCRAEGEPGRCWDSLARPLCPWCWEPARSFHSQCYRVPAWQGGARVAWADEPGGH